jgi:DNA-binding XRE family transcriptional regulator
LYPIGRGLFRHQAASIRSVPRKARKPPRHPALKKLGARVRQLREQQKLSQEALADAAGFGRSHTSGIERGIRNPSALQLIRLARSLRVTDRGSVHYVVPDRVQ